MLPSTKNLSIPFDKPVEIHLQSLTPLPARSPTSVDLAMFTLIDGRKLYLPIFVFNKVAQLGLKPGESFFLSKTKRNDRVEWLAWKPDQAPKMGPGLAKTRIEAALRLGLDVAMNAERFSDEIGYPVRFNASDVRAFGMAVYSNMQRGKHA